MKRLICSFLVLATFASCKDDESDDQGGIMNLSDDFAICNAMLSACNDGNGSYCLFGLKWGAGNPLINAGFEAEGPGEAGGLITFSFQEENGTVNTHSQISLPGRSFENLPACAKTEIRSALNKWSAAANIAFEEVAENSDSDIRFFVADTRQSGIGYPNFIDAPCNIIGGDLIIQTEIGLTDCNEFHNFISHEVGHVLGLGHVSTANVMNANFSEVRDLTGLQSGDIEGIVSIYGEK